MSNLLRLSLFMVRYLLLVIHLINVILQVTVPTIITPQSGSNTLCVKQLNFYWGAIPAPVLGVLNDWMNEIKWNHFTITAQIGFTTSLLIVSLFSRPSFRPVLYSKLYWKIPYYNNNPQARQLAARTPYFSFSFYFL